jgi:hypothetical protein
VTYHQTNSPAQSVQSGQYMPDCREKSFDQTGSAAFGKSASTRGNPICHCWSVAYVWTTICRSGTPCIGHLAGFASAARSAAQAIIKSFRFIGAFSVIALCVASSTSAATYSLPSDRSHDWANNTGVIGGIPTISTLHSNVVTAGADNTGANDAKDVIQTALNDCPQGSYVYVPAGVYRLDTALSIPAGAVLRGDGNSTILRVNHTGYGISARADVTPTTRTNIAAHVVKGSTNLWVSEHHEELAIGRKLTVAYVNNPQPLVWLPSSGNTNGGFQMNFVIKGTNGNNVHIDAAPLDCLTNNPVLVSHISTRSLAPKTLVGIENCHITNFSGTMDGGISFVDTHNCWISGVKISAASTSSGAINITDSTRITVYGCVINRRGGDDDVDGISVGGNSQGILIENNAIDGMWPGIMLGEGGSVMSCAVLYNYIIKPYVSSVSDWIASSIGCHGGHTAMILVEGNIAEGFVQLDGFHASASHWAFFKNWFKGDVSEAGKTARRWTMDLTHYSYTNSIIRNVLGVSGYTWTLTATNQFGYSDYNLIYRLGYPGMGHQGFTGVRPPESYTNYEAFDYEVTNSIILHGNYDYANEDFVNKPGEETTFADSLYYAGSPSYWGALAWPRDGMEVTNAIPAMALAIEQASLPPRRKFKGIRIKQQ